MTYTIGVVNRGTVQRRVHGILAGIVAISLVGAAATGLTQLSHNHSLDRNADRVEAALEQKDFALASTLIESYAKDSGLRQGDYERLVSDLETEVKRQPFLLNFDEAVNAYSFNEARAILAELEEKGLVDKRFAATLEARIQEVTPDGLYQRINNAEPSKREPLLRAYLTVYPTGEHAATVRSEASALLLADMIDIERSLIEGRSFDDTYKKLVSLDGLLALYSGKGIAIAGFIPSEQIIKESGEYLQLPAYPAPKGTEIMVGDRVKTLAVPVTVTNHKKRYVEERTNTFPDGSIGTVIARHYYDYWRFWVQFPEVTKYAWTQEWGLQNFWLNGKKDVALYLVNELQPVVEVTAIQKAQFEVEVEKFVRIAAELK